MSQPPEKKHPWAKFKATPSTPRSPSERALPRAFAPKQKAVVPLPPSFSKSPPAPSGPKAEQPLASPASLGVSAPREEQLPSPAKAGEKAEVKPPPKAVAAAVVKPETKPVHRPEAKTEAPRVVAEVAPRAVPAKDRVEAKPVVAEVKPVVSAEMASVLSELEKAELDPAVVKRVRPEAETSPRQKYWLWHGLKESVQNYRRTLARLRVWWRAWRTGSSARVLLAFVVIYGLLAMMRKPSEVSVERSRIGEEIAFLQGFLKSFCKVGGPVLAEKPHGGAELYPRGVLLKGEILERFERAPVGGVFSIQITAPMWNPLEGFFGFPPIFSGGAYFHLERRVNFALYRFSYLVRKDTEQGGSILLSLVERVN